MYQQAPKTLEESTAANHCNDDNYHEIKPKYSAEMKYIKKKNSAERKGPHEPTQRGNKVKGVGAIAVRAIIINFSFLSNVLRGNKFFVLYSRSTYQ